MSCDSVYCMCGAAWSSRWLMTQLTNGKRACVSCVHVIGGHFEHTSWLAICFFFCTRSLCFTSHNRLDATGNILRVHYKRMKCDVLFSLGSVISTLFRWGGHFCQVYVKVPSCLQQCKNYKNRSRFPRVMITNVLPPFYGSQCSSNLFLPPAVRCYCTLCNWEVFFSFDGKILLQC